MVPGNAEASTSARTIAPGGNKSHHPLASFNSLYLLPHSPPTSEPNDPRPDSIASMSSAHGSDSGSVVFDNGDHNGQSGEHETEETSTTPDEPGSYDLKPPPPAVSLSNAERIAELLFSVGHLNLILRDHFLAQGFAKFLSAYRPHLSRVLMQYQECQKAIASIHYANALVESAFGDTLRIEDIEPDAAALGPEFEKEFLKVQDQLLSEGLTAFITHKLVQTVTECLVKEISGNQLPFMRGLAEGIAETYCMTDPNLPDNPIIYASEGFYFTTQYGRDYVMGRNCRFLQGPESSRPTVGRLKKALDEGVEICETLLNYRRDGTPFVNLLMMAPLHDNKGKVRYFIGAQVDVTGLVDGGKGMDSFAKLLAHHDIEAEARSNGEDDGNSEGKAMRALRRLCTNLSTEEAKLISQPMPNGRGSDSGSLAGSLQSQSRTPMTRRRYLASDEPVQRNLFASPHLGKSGRLPGVYQNFLLVRPYPSLRITFTSPALRIPGLAQTRLPERISSANNMRDQIVDAFAQGIGVTARVQWLAHQNDQDGRPRWIHATPLFGSDDKVGVWMVVMAEHDDHNANGPSFAYAPQNLRSPLRDGPGPAPNGDAPGLTPKSKNRHGTYSSGSASDLYASYLHRERPHQHGQGQGSQGGQQQQQQQQQPPPRSDSMGTRPQSRREKTSREQSIREQFAREQSRLDQLHTEHKSHRELASARNHPERGRASPEQARQHGRQASRTRHWAAHLKDSLSGRNKTPEDGLDELSSTVGADNNNKKNVGRAL